METIVSKTTGNSRETDAPDNSLVCKEDMQYYLAEIDTSFHNGEAVVKFDRNNNLWRCIFTLRNRIIATIYSVQIEKEAVTRIIKEQDQGSFDDFVAPGYPDSNLHRPNIL